MDDHDWLAERFEANRAHLRARGARREEPLAARLPDPVVTRPDGTDPEHQALVADGVGLALLVVLDTLTPAERLAFVLHDLFAVPFDEIAAILGRSPAATRQLASRARRRVQGAAPAPDPDRRRQRAVVDAFLAAARDGDFDALLAVLDPDVVLRAEHAGASREVRGAPAVAESALSFAWLAESARPVLVNGAAGVSRRRMDGRSRSWDSRSHAGRSSRSTSSPTPSASASST